MVETTWERKKTKAEDSKASTKRPEHHNLYLANTRRWAHGQGDSEDVVWWWGENEVYIWFPAMTSFGNIPC